MAYSPTSVVVISILLPLIALAAVAVRFWVRLRVAPTYIGIDDWLIAAAAILTLGDGANLAVGAIAGRVGRDYEVIPPDRNLVEARVDFVTIIEKPIYGFMKLSVLFFFRRIFKTRNAFRIINNILIVLITAWFVSYTFAGIFLCGKHVWKIVTPDMHGTNNGCADLDLLNLTFAITDAVTDILVLSMPYPFLKRLQMCRREKLGVVAIFALGMLSTICTFIRLATIIPAYHQNFSDPGNHHTSGVPTIVWSTIEAAVGVLAACLPPMGPLLRGAPRRFSTSMSYLTRRKSSEAVEIKAKDYDAFTKTGSARSEHTEDTSKPKSIQHPLDALLDRDAWP